MPSHPNEFEESFRFSTSRRELIRDRFVSCGFRARSRLTSFGSSIWSFRSSCRLFHVYSVTLFLLNLRSTLVRIGLFRVGSFGVSDVFCLWELEIRKRFEVRVRLTFSSEGLVEWRGTHRTASWNSGFAVTSRFDCRQVVGRSEEVSGRQWPWDWTWGNWGREFEDRSHIDVTVEFGVMVREDEREDERRIQDFRRGVEKGTALSKV